MATKQHNVRLPDDLSAAIELAVAERGYESASAFMRHAIQKELRHDDNAVAEVATRIAATLNPQAKELRSVHTAQLATFAYVDALTKVLLTCIAEPSGPLHTSYSQPPAGMTTSGPTGAVSQLQNSTQDIRSFVEAKQPKSDIQFAAVVAYFHQFVAREGERKETIDKEVLKDAFRKAQRKIPKDCGFTLVNALNAGVLDRKDGKFSVNFVGENLVAMTLPGDAASPSVSKGRKKSRKPAQRTGAKNRSR